MYKYYFDWGKDFECFFEKYKKKAYFCFFSPHIYMDLNDDSSDNNTSTDKAFQEVEFIKEPIVFAKEFVKEFV